MRRRDLLLLISGAVAALPRTARADRQRRVGFLSSTSVDGMDSSQLAAVHRGVNETGYVEGRNLVIEYRWADGDYTRLSAEAAELVRGDVEVIMAFGGAQPARAAMEATGTIDLSVAPIRRGWRPDQLWTQRHGRISPIRHLRRKNPQGRKAGRSAGPAADDVRAGDQP